MKTIAITWLWMSCVVSGPGVPSEFDLTGDGQVDLRDVAEFQNHYTGERAMIVLPWFECGP